jgi:hypothetical protein
MKPDPGAPVQAVVVDCVEFVCATDAVEAGTWTHEMEPMA